MGSLAGPSPDSGLDGAQARLVTGPPEQRRPISLRIRLGPLAPAGPSTDRAYRLLAGFQDGDLSLPGVRPDGDCTGQSGPGTAGGARGGDRRSLRARAHAGPS